MTSIEGSASRAYLAAEVPPHPPPITTTRRPAFCAKSETFGAQPAARSPSPAQDDVRRNSLRVDCVMQPSADRVRIELDDTERVRFLVPGRQHSPGERDRDDQQDRAAPAKRDRQEDGHAELL